MEWFVDEPARGQIALAIIAITIAAGGIWFGRKRLLLAVPVALAILFLAAIAIPSAIPAQTAAQRRACINNLKLLQDAKAEWAKSNNKLPADIPTEADLYGTNGIGGILHDRLLCPRGSTYTIGAVGQNPTCIFFSNKGHRLQ